VTKSNKHKWLQCIRTQSPVAWYSNTFMTNYLIQTDDKYCLIFILYVHTALTAACSEITSKAVSVTKHTHKHTNTHREVMQVASDGSWMDRKDKRIKEWSKRRSRWAVLPVRQVRRDALERHTSARCDCSPETHALAFSRFPLDLTC